jgi:nitrous oxide reductase accessory protein NosL
MAAGKRFSVLFLFLLLIAQSSLAYAESIHCTECGMTMDTDSKFSARIVQTGATLHFCDIGDLFSYKKRKSVRDGSFQVKDYTTGEVIDARTAWFVKNEKKFSTPMGWSIAAFRDKTRAAEFGAVMNFDETAASLK